jgi:hypothetical protein
MSNGESQRAFEICLLYGFLYTGDNPRASREGNALNLDIDALGQLLDSDAAPGGLVGEPLGVLLVHALKESVLV